MMAVTKEEFKAALAHGAPADGPFDISDEDRNEALAEYYGIPEREAVVEEEAPKPKRKRKPKAEPEPEPEVVEEEAEVTAEAE